MFALNTRTNGVAFFLRRWCNGKRLCVFAAATIVLICAYSLSSGGSSNKTEVSVSANGATGKAHEVRGTSALSTPISNTATAHTPALRQNLTRLVQQLRQACAVQDSALLMRAERGFDSMAVRAPNAYDYKFWLGYIRQKRVEFIQSAPHDSMHVAPQKKSPNRVATSQSPRAPDMPQSTFPSVQIGQAKAASAGGENNARTVHNKSASPRRPANETKNIPVPALSEHQKAEAEQLYVQGYKIMAYKNRTAYLQALLLFKKTQATAPDPKFKYHQKAGEKIVVIEKELAKFENE